MTRIKNESERERERERDREGKREREVETHLGQKFSGSRKDELGRKKFIFYYLHLC